MTQKLKPFVPLLIVGFVMLMIIVPVVASQTEIGPRDTAIAGNEHYSLNIISDNTPCTSFAWRSQPHTRFDVVPSKTIEIHNINNVVFEISEFTGYEGQWYCYNGGIKENSPYFYIRLPETPTQTPTPVPTPSSASIIIQSSPDGATIFVNNVIKGITPLSINVPNGDYTVRIRMDDYQEFFNTVSVIGQDVAVNAELVPEETPTQTTVPTTEPTTAPTTEVTTPPVTPEPTVNYSATIAVIQNQVEEQATKNAEQDVAISEQAEQIGIIQYWINAIKAFLGLE